MPKIEGKQILLFLGEDIIPSLLPFCVFSASLTKAFKIVVLFHKIFHKGYFHPCYIAKKYKCMEAFTIKPVLIIPCFFFFYYYSRAESFKVVETSSLFN